MTVDAVAEVLLRFARQIHAAMWSAYRAAGAPYGDTEAGLLRWARECREAADLRERADRIEAIHATCAMLRQASQRAAG